jgi:hypothetical protein
VTDPVTLAGYLSFIENRVLFLPRTITICKENASKFVVAAKDFLMPCRQRQTTSLKALMAHGFV